jgi:molybdate transport system ATP-binding protein
MRHSKRFHPAQQPDIIPQRPLAVDKPCLISMRDLDVTIQGHKILSGITWCLKPDEHWAFIGRNGSGKTTLLRLIRGDLWPDVESRGKRVYRFGEEEQESSIGIKDHIALVSSELQHAYIRHAWDLRGGEVISTGFFDTPWLHQELTEEQHKSVEKVIRRLRLNDLRDKNFLEMSQGEARKILIARALVSTPDILILDEFCNGIDPSSRKKLLHMIETVAHSHTQILSTTHRAQELIPSITHVLFLENGKIMKQGRKELLLPSGHRGKGNSKMSTRVPVFSNVKNHALLRQRNTARSYLLRIKDADVYINDKRILQTIAWQMNRGENWAFLGRNGSGKSTLMKVILGELHPALGGKVFRFGGTGDDALWEIRKRIGIISPEIQAEHGHHIQGSEVIQSGFFTATGICHELSREQMKTVRRWVDFFHLNDVIEKSSDQMSAGELWKTIIARAMVNNPDILVLDEPLSGLDSATKKDFLGVLEHLSGTGTRIILVTHHLDEIPPSITHVALMDGGRIIAQGKKEDVIPITRSFLLPDEMDQKV